MAFKPSMRAHNKIKEIPLDIRPVMNLMVVLIPILLYSAEFVKLSIRELNLPPASSADKKGPGDEELKEEEKRFGLTVLIGKNGFFIGNRAGYLTGETDTQGEPAIPLNENGEYDYKFLQDKLADIKGKIKGQGFVDENSIIISAEADIAYKHILRVIDFATVIEDSSGTEQELFPQINIGQVIL